MACKQEGILRILIDGFLLILVFLPTLILEEVSGLSQFKRGFFCNDDSLSKPYKDSTISAALTICVGGVLNLVAIVVCEAVAVRNEKARHAEPSGYQLSCLMVRPEIARFCHVFFIFLFGAGIQQSITNGSKFCVGRLRPHFLDVCRPNYTTFSCVDEHAQPRYVTENVCTGLDEKKNLEMRLSFPSGHASLAAYCMVFLVMYLQVRMTCQRLRLIRTVLQAAALWLAVGVCLSRVSDYMHHWSDVLGGALLGGTIGALTIRYVLPLSRLDMHHDDRKKEQPTGTGVTDGVANNAYDIGIQEL